jgi:hypothetical protein
VSVSRTPLLIMVGADKGGVGKTTLSRALLDYLTASKGIPSSQITAYDTEWPAGDLRRFHHGALVIDIEKIADQMRVFDKVDGVTVIDIRAGLMSTTLRTMAEARLLDDVRSGAMNLALLHVLGPTINSFMEIDQASRLVGGGTKHFVVKNRINETEYEGWDKDPRFALIFKQVAGMTIEVPHLASMACDTVQQREMSFASFRFDKEQSRVLRGHVGGWLDAVWQGFDQVGLGALVEAAKPPAAA